MFWLQNWSCVQGPEWPWASPLFNSEQNSCGVSWSSPSGVRGKAQLIHKWLGETKVKLCFYLKPQVILFGVYQACDLGKRLKMCCGQSLNYESIISFSFSGPPWPNCPHPSEVAVLQARLLPSVDLTIQCLSPWDYLVEEGAADLQGGCSLLLTVFHPLHFICPFQDPQEQQGRYHHLYYPGGDTRQVGLPQQHWAWVGVRDRIQLSDHRVPAALWAPWDDLCCPQCRTRPSHLGVISPGGSPSPCTGGRPSLLQPDQATPDRETVAAGISRKNWNTSRTKQIQLWEAGWLL